MPLRMLCFLLVASLAGAQPARFRLDVPFVRQEKNGCGAAAISMVIEYWRGSSGAGSPARAQTIQRMLYSREANGIFAGDMERYFREQGFRTFAFQGEWEDLARHLSKGRPLIVCLKEGGSRHFVVVSGLDEEHALVLLNDPARRKLAKADRAGFEKQWRAMSNWTLLALPQHAR